MGYWVSTWATWGSTVDWLVSTLDLMVSMLERQASTEVRMGSTWGLPGNGVHQTRDWQENTAHHS